MLVRVGSLQINEKMMGRHCWFPFALAGSPTRKRARMPNAARRVLGIFPGGFCHVVSGHVVERVYLLHLLYSLSLIESCSAS